MLNNEIWLKIDDLPYEINSDGTVRRIAGTSNNWKNKTHIRPYKNNKGYLCIHLYKNSKCYKFQIHRLLAKYFIPNPNKYNEVNHIDGNPLNNSLDNLEWCTHQENILHAVKTGLFKKDRSIVTQVKKRNASSQYFGVSWSKERQKWVALLTWRKKKYSIGRFIDEIEAAKAYDAKVKELGFHLDGCKLNFI